MEDVETNDRLPSFKQLFQKELFLFKLMGLSSINGILTDQKLVRKWWDGLSLLIGSVMVCTVVICECETLFEVFSNDLEYTIGLLALICPGILCTLKALRLWTYRSKLYDLLQTIRIMWDSARCEESLSIRVTKAAERTKLLTKYYMIVLTCLSISLMIRPYIWCLDYHFNNHLNVSFDFSQIVYPTKLPFTIDSFTKYFICVSYQQLVSLAGNITWVTSDILFAQLTTHVSLQFTILADNLKQTVNKCSSLSNDEQMPNSMVHVINKYQQLITCCDSIETFFNPIVFFTIVFNAMNLCCCLYQLDQEIKAGDWDEVTKSTVHIITLSFQTVIFCGFSDHLTESVLTILTTQISEAIYHSQWTGCNHKIKMSLLIIMIRAQKKFSYTTYGIITLDYNQLTQIANATVSYFMFLRNFS